MSIWYNVCIEIGRDIAKEKMMTNLVADTVNVLLDEYNRVEGEDSIGEMMEYLDRNKVEYSALTELRDIECNEAIRALFRVETVKNTLATLGLVKLTIERIL